MNELSVPLVIPNNPALQSFGFRAQTALLVPGVNNLGITTTSGICARVGN